jgi:hypothetical protein
VRRTIVVAGSIAQRPGFAGHAWMFLQYLLGFTNLGYEIVFVDRLEPGACTDRCGHPCPLERSVQAAWLDRIMKRVGLNGRWSLACGSTTLGLEDATVDAALRRSVLLLDVMGHLGPDRGALASHRAFLDIDPGFGQMWQEKGLARLFGDHHHYVTVGTRIGAADCAVPALGLEWMPTLPPVVLSQWPYVSAREGAPFTTVASWRGPFGPVEHDGATYGLRVHEFRSYHDLPARCDDRFVAALDIDDADGADADRLRDGGWDLVSPHGVAADLDVYRTFVQGSGAEILVAKNMYVRARTGWISDRSPCYLASGHPVLMQDTGIDAEFAADAGLLLFASPDEAVELVAHVRRDAPRLGQRARHAAETVFAADIVLERLLARLGIRS